MSKTTEGMINNFLSSSIDEQEDDNMVLEINIKDDSYGRMKLIDGERAQAEHKKGLRKMLADYAKEKIRPTDQAEFAEFINFDTLNERLIAANNILIKEYLEYNGHDAWNLVRVFLMRSPDEGSEWPVMLLIHVVAKHNVSVMHGNNHSVREFNDLLEIDPMTGLAKRNSFLNGAKKVIDASDKEYCLLHIEISQFRVFNRKYGRNAGERLIMNIGSFLKNMDAVYNSFSSYEGGENFNVLIEDDPMIIRYVKSGINNIVSNFEGVKEIKAVFGACRFSEKENTIHDLLDCAAIAVSYNAENEDGICWYNPEFFENEVDEETNLYRENFTKVFRSVTHVRTSLDRVFDEMLLEYMESGANSDESMERLLKTIQKTYDLDVVYIMAALPNQEGLTFVMEAVKEEQYSQVSDSIPLTQEFLENISEIAKTNEFVEIPINPGKIGITPNLLEKLYIRDDEIDGAVGIATYYNRKWTDEEREIVRRLEVLCRSVVGRHRIGIYETALKKMETVDVLTGLLNRNSFERNMDKLKGETKGVGVLYADLNGLKETNDNFGHDAGDKLLCRAANAFMTSFDYHDIYRFGGDEFVVADTDTTKEEFVDKVDTFKDFLKLDDDLSISYGMVWNESNEKINEMIRIADEKMYESKRKYKESHKLL